MARKKRVYANAYSRPDVATCPVHGITLQVRERTVLADGRVVQHRKCSLCNHRAKNVVPANFHQDQRPMTSTPASDTIDPSTPSIEAAVSGSLRGGSGDMEASRPNEAACRPGESTGHGAAALPTLSEGAGVLPATEANSIASSDRDASPDGMRREQPTGPSGPQRKASTMDPTQLQDERSRLGLNGHQMRDRQRNTKPSPSPQTFVVEVYRGSDLLRITVNAATPTDAWAIACDQWKYFPGGQANGRLVATLDEFRAIEAERKAASAANLA